MMFRRKNKLELGDDLDSEDEAYGADDFHGSGDENDNKDAANEETYDHLFQVRDLNDDEDHSSDDGSREEEESFTSSAYVLNDEEALENEDDEISDVSYDSHFEGDDDPTTVYSRKFQLWLESAPPPHLAKKKKKKKKKDKFVAEQVDVPDAGDIVDKKYDWLYRKKKRLDKRDPSKKKETHQQMVDRIAKRADLEQAENAMAEAEAALARRQASLAALGIKLGPKGKPTDDSDDDNDDNKLEDTNILHQPGWHRQQYDVRMNALFKSICKPELKV